MIGEVKHLANNERYRLLVIDDKTYLMDIEESFWKVIFPFLFWLIPNPIYRLDDEATVDQLKTKKMERKNLDSMTTNVGIGVAGGVFLQPLAVYFFFTMTPLIKTLVMIITIILVGLLYINRRQNSEKKLDTLMNFGTLKTEQIKIRPNSIGHFLKVIFIYFGTLGFTIGSFLEIENYLMLIIGSLFMFVFLLTNRRVVEEGSLVLRFKNNI